jgi:hypothetical protein
LVQDFVCWFVWELKRATLYRIEQRSYRSLLDFALSNLARPMSLARLVARQALRRPVPAPFALRGPAPLVVLRGFAANMEQIKVRGLIARRSSNAVRAFIE